MLRLDWKPHGICRNTQPTAVWVDPHALGTNRHISRTDQSENRAQWAMFVLALCSMISLIVLDVQNGSIWGSTYLPKPLAVLCLAFAFMARLNIKGRNISQGMNPHQIMKQNRESEGDSD